MTDRASFKQLSAAEALRALYIDFEGRKDEPPVLIGVHSRGRGPRPHVQQDVMDVAFEGLTPRHRPLLAEIDAVVRRAERRDRRIVAWSEHELDVVRTLADEAPALVARFEARYVNARLVARRWRNKCHDADNPAEHALAAYLDLIDYAVPDGVGPGHVGDTVRDIRARRERGLEPTDGQRARWGNLLEHNRHDCVGMRAVCLQATRELEAVG